MQFYLFLLELNVFKLYNFLITFLYLCIFYSLKKRKTSGLVPIHHSFSPYIVSFFSVGTFILHMNNSTLEFELVLTNVLGHTIVFKVSGIDSHE